MTINPDQHNTPDTDTTEEGSAYEGGTYQGGVTEQQYVDEHPSGEIAAARYANFATEEPINPREQRLRAAPAPAQEVENDHDHVADDIDTPEQQPEQPRYDDPYGVGQPALEANNIPATAVASTSGEPEASNYTPSALERRREQFGSASTALYPAQWGWRGWCNRTIGTKIPPRNPSPEVDYRLGVETIQMLMPGIPLIAVADPKGGENKTGTSLALSATLGTHTGAGVVAWDASSSFGSMAMRAHIGRSDERSSWTLLPEAHKLVSSRSVQTAIDAHLIRQPTLDDILPAADSGLQRKQLDWSACEAILAVLRVRRRVIIVDTDNNHLAESLRWALVRADQIVVPMTACDDTVQEVEAMLRLAKSDPDIGETKVSQAIVLLSPLPDAPVTPERREVIEMMLEQFGISTILDMPFDPLFSGHRGRIVYADLLPATRNMYVELAAMITARLNTRAMTSTVSLSAPPPPQTYTGQWAAAPAPAPTPSAPPLTGYAPQQQQPAGELAHLARPALREDYPRQEPAWQQPHSPGSPGGFAGSPGRAQYPPQPQPQFTGYQVDTTTRSEHAAGPGAGYGAGYGPAFDPSAGMHRAR